MTMDEFVRHRGRYAKMVGRPGKSTELHLYPNIIAEVHFDKFAGCWAVRGADVVPAALDLVGPDAKRSGLSFPLSQSGTEPEFTGNPQSLIPSVVSYRRFIAPNGDAPDSLVSRYIQRKTMPARKQFFNLIGSRERIAAKTRLSPRNCIAR